MPNWERLKAIMAKNRLEGLVATSPENVTYLTGFRAFGHVLLRDTQVYAVLPLAGEVRVVAPKGELDLAAEYGIAPEQVVPFGTFHAQIPENLAGAQEQFGVMLRQESLPSAAEALVQAIKTAGLGNGVIGIDESRISLQVLDSLPQMLPGVRIKRAAGVFSQIRMVKTVDEIRRLRSAAQITEAACLHTMDQAREGMTELELAIIFEKALLDRGARPSFTVLGFGDHSAFLNVQPTGRQLKKGDIVRFDIGCNYDYYHADIARTFVFGAIKDKRIPAYYRAIRNGEQQALDAIRPGVLASEIFRIAVDGVREEGLPAYNRHHCGHGIGIEVYDPPIIGPGNNTVLEPGMVLCIETPYYELGFGGFQVEDTLVVTDDGCELFTRAPEELAVTG